MGKDCKFCLIVLGLFVMEVSLGLYGCWKYLLGKKGEVKEYYFKDFGYLFFY